MKLLRIARSRSRIWDVEDGRDGWRSFFFSRIALNREHNERTFERISDLFIFCSRHRSHRFSFSSRTFSRVSRVSRVSFYSNIFHLFGIRFLFAPLFHALPAMR